MKSGLVSFLWKKMGQDPGGKNVTVFEQIKMKTQILEGKWISKRLVTCTIGAYCIFQNIK